MTPNRVSVRDRVLKNLEASRNAREKSNYGGKGLNYDEHKFNSKNYDKLAKSRGWDKKVENNGKTQAQNTKESFNKWAGENKNKSYNQDVTVKHSPPGGDKAHAYGTKGYGRPSGQFVSPTQYTSADKAKGELRPPTKNQMTEGREVRVHGDQIRGTVAPQKEGFETSRPYGKATGGGGKQIVTKGGFSSGAVKEVPGTTRDLKTSGGKTDGGKSQTDEFGVDISEADKPKGASHDQSRKK